MRCDAVAWADIPSSSTSWLAAPPRIEILRKCLDLAFAGDDKDPSILLQPELGDKAPGLIDLLNRESLVVLAAQIKQLLIEICDRRGVGGLLKSFLERVVQHLDDLHLHTLWTGNAEWRVRNYVDADLPQGLHARPIFAAHGTPSHQQPEPAGVDALRPSARVSDRMDMAAEQRIHRIGIALERDVGPFDALPLGNLLHCDVQARAGARRAIVDLAGIGLRIGEELLERLPRRIIPHHHTERVTADADDVGEICAWIESGLGHERKAEHRDRNLRDRVAVGLGVRGHLSRRECPGAARSVLDDDRLPEMLFGRARERTHAEVGGPARRPRHDEGHGADRKILRLRGADPCGKSGCEHGAEYAPFHGGFPPGTGPILRHQLKDGPSGYVRSLFAAIARRGLCPRIDSTIAALDDRDARHRDRSPEIRRHARGLSQAARADRALPRLLRRAAARAVEFHPPGLDA